MDLEFKNVVPRIQKKAEGEKPKIDKVPIHETEATWLSCFIKQYKMIIGVIIVIIIIIVILLYVFRKKEPTEVADTENEQIINNSTEEELHAILNNEVVITIDETPNTPVVVELDDILEEEKTDDEADDEKTDDEKTEAIGFNVMGDEHIKYGDDASSVQSNVTSPGVDSCQHFIAAKNRYCSFRANDGDSYCKKHGKK
jgi:hypothetical protein